MNKNYDFIGKCVYFPEENIIAIGDLHMGYDQYLEENGLNFPLKQFKEMKEEIAELFAYMKKRNKKVERVVLLGDLKHGFGFQKREFFDLIKFVDYIANFVKRENIICMRGNHDKFNIASINLLDFYVSPSGKIGFLHGHKSFPGIYDKNIKILVIGHLHPILVLRDKMKIKSEKYKAFFVGEPAGKRWIVVPSFLPFIEGSEIETGEEENFAILNSSEIYDFEVFICQDVGKASLSFGKLKRYI